MNVVEKNAARSIFERGVAFALALMTVLITLATEPSSCPTSQFITISMTDSNNLPRQRFFLGQTMNFESALSCSNDFASNAVLTTTWVLPAAGTGNMLTVIASTWGTNLAKVHISGTAADGSEIICRSMTTNFLVYSNAVLRFTIPANGTNLTAQVGTTNLLETLATWEGKVLTDGLVTFSNAPSVLGTLTPTAVNIDAQGKSQTSFIASTNGMSGTNFASASGLVDPSDSGFSLPNVSTNVPVHVGKLEIDPVSSGTTITATSPLNAITNSAAIVIDPDHPAGDGGTATIVAVTRFEPASLNLTPTDERVVWTIDDPNKAGFLDGKNKGRVVKVFGKAEGRVLLTATLTDADGNVSGRDFYEAQVVAEKQIPFRVNLLRLQTGNIGTAVHSAAQAEKHIAIANIYLRQIGVKLVPDENTDAGNTNGVTNVQLLKKGYFKVTLPQSSANLVKNVIDPGNSEITIQKNHRPNVVQITYIESMQLPAELGALVSRPGNTNGLSITRKYRIIVGEDSSDHTMNLRPARVNLGGADVWGVVITDANGNAVTDAQRYGNTIAHEGGGHLLNLAHRAAPASDPIPDGLDKPQNKNLMDASSPSPIAEDLDLIQKDGARGSNVTNPSP